MNVRLHHSSREVDRSGEGGDAYSTADFQGGICRLRLACRVLEGTGQMFEVPSHQDTGGLSSTYDQPSLACGWLFWRLPTVTGTLLTNSQSKVGKIWSQILTSVTFPRVTLQDPASYLRYTSVSPAPGTACHTCRKDSICQRPWVCQRTPTAVTE